MSLHIIETGEVVEPLTKVEAERLTARIADKLDSIADNLEQVLPLIGEALTRQAWSALEYPSPTAYVRERFAGALTRLPYEIRQPVVHQLSAAGMSTRAIAPIVGVSKSQVANDLDAGVQKWTPEPSLPTSERIIGMDGKTYTRPEPQPEPTDPPKQKRRPITDQARDAGWELRRAVERLERIYSDERYMRSKNEIDSLIEPHIEYALSVITTH